MKGFILSFAVVLFSIPCFAQQALPVKTYTGLRDSTNSVDIVFYQGKGGSLSLDGKNVQVFNSLFENKAVKKKNIEKSGSIMWQIDGREFLSGIFYLGDSSGYVLADKDGKEYSLRLNNQGNNFLRSKIKY